MSQNLPQKDLLLRDAFGRVHSDLRVSVTDRCNIRCFYCMPAEEVTFMAKEKILTFEEIIRFARISTQLGIRKIRLTGGEPLLRKGLAELVRMLIALPGLEDLALTTNGMLLEKHAETLRAAGLHRLNISLDALTPATFERIARRKGLEQVLGGIEAACEAGFSKIKLNAVSIKGLTESEIVPLAQFARSRNLELRFIEYMPLDAEKAWAESDVLSGEQVQKLLANSMGALHPVKSSNASQPARDFQYAEGGGRVGFINSVSEPFCASCNRLRLTAEGKIQNCLFSENAWDVRELMRSGQTDEAVIELLHAALGAKKKGHGMDEPDFIRPTRAMYKIGG